MALEKALIRPEAPAGAQPIPVLFNPGEYTFSGSTAYSETSGLGSVSPLLQFTHGNAGTLTMQLFVDTYESGGDVRAYTDRIYGLLEVERTTHAPPVCTFSWGGFSFRGVLEQVGGRFTLFLDDGTPARATLDVSFKQYVDPSDSVRMHLTESADHAKTYAVRRGDTLSAIAAAEYGDPRVWRVIADANRIANPRVLHPGRLLALPPLPAGRLP